MDFKYIAEPSMHSMPAVALHPNSKLLFKCYVLLQLVPSPYLLFIAPSSRRSEQCSSFFPIIPCWLCSRLQDTGKGEIQGAFFWDYFGIGLLGIDGIRVLLGAIPFSE